MQTVLSSLSKRIFCLFAVIFWSCSNLAVASTMDFKEAKILVGEEQLLVEFADVWELRAKGLMHRKSLCDDCGMLFKFKPARQVAMWMKNTYVPLDVAYFKKDGTITDIKPLQPLDLTSVPSSFPVTFALEMNQGWFAKHKVAVGDKIQVLETSN